MSALIANAGTSFVAWLLEQDQALIVTWQVLAAIVTAASIMVVALMAYLRAYFGGEMMRNKFETLERIGQEIRTNLQPLERRVEAIEEEVRDVRRLRDQDDPHKP